MEVHFSPDLQTKLERVATLNSSDADGYVQQLVERYLDHDVWFRQKVKAGLEQLDRGEYLTHEEVGERIERMFRS
jgi:predicted transcriptional regulator